MDQQRVGVIGAIVYFALFGAAFVFSPRTVERLGLTWTGAAGKTEVRCYYGAVSWALAGFLGYLLSEGLDEQAITGVLFLATAVLTTRVIGALVDRGWSEAYNRQAIPIETAFVLVIGILRFTG